MKTKRPQIHLNHTSFRIHFGNIQKITLKDSNYTVLKLKQKNIL